MQCWQKHPNLFKLGGMVIDIVISILSECNHKPAKAWNCLLERAYNEKCDFFFQIGDDVEFLTPNWPKKFIDVMCAQTLQGIVGPCDPVNYTQRMNKVVI